MTKVTHPVIASDVQNVTHPPPYDVGGMKANTIFHGNVIVCMKYEQQPGSGASAASSNNWDQESDDNSPEPLCFSQSCSTFETIFAYSALSVMWTRCSVAPLLSFAESLSL